MEPFKKNLNVSNGQVAATATAIATGVANHSRTLNLSFCNTGSTEETLILTLSINGGTARRVKRVVLGANQEYKRTAFALDRDDTLYAVTTNASTVDYTISMTEPGTPATECVYDEFGGVKTAPYILEQLADVVG